MAGPSEEILIRVGMDTTGVDRGMTAMQRRINQTVGMTTQADRAYSDIWHKAEMERERDLKKQSQQKDQELQKDLNRINTIKQANDAWIQKKEQAIAKGKVAWKEELQSQREAANGPIHRNGIGVNMANLAANVTGSGGRVGGVGVTGYGGHGARGEAVVIARELSRLNIGAAVRSTSILVSRMGLLGTVMAAITSPVGILAASLLAIGAVGYKLGKYATELIRNAQQAGVNTSFYQGVGQAASRAGGDSEGSQAALQQLADRVGDVRAGSLEVWKNFHKWGIELDTVNGVAKSQQQIFADIVAKSQAISDPATRKAFLNEMFGKGSDDIQKVINSGADFTEGGAGERNLGGLSNAYTSVKGVLSTAASSAGNFITGFVGSLANTFGMGNLTDAQQRSKDIDAQSAALEDSGVIHKVKHKMSPDMQKKVVDIQYEQQSAQAALADRNKQSVDDMAQQALRLTGAMIPTAHTLTPLMRDALHIKQLEAAAGLAYQSKTPEGLARGKALTAQANAIRKSDEPYMTLADSDPQREAVKALDSIQGDMDWVTDALKNYFIEKGATTIPAKGKGSK